MFMKKKSSGDGAETVHFYDGSAALVLIHTIGAGL